MTEHVLDIADRRKASRQARLPITISMEAAEIALAVTGVEVGPETKILVRITDAKDGVQGYARRIGPDQFLVKVRVQVKETYTDKHAWVLNSSLLHELRHVAQMQAEANFDALYAVASATVGYQDNPYEAEARHYGRLADHTGTKDTGPAGKALGKDVWAIVPKGVTV